MISLDGRSLSFTGEKCAHWAGHRTGDDYACQGNILVGPEVIDAMNKSFEDTEGSLADRLYAALQAGDDVGGDIRGKQSARMMVVKKGDRPGDDTVVDVTIEDHEEPVKEIGRILSKRKSLLQCRQLVKGLDQASGENKLEALQILEKYLENNADRSFIDAWTMVGYVQLELGLREEAVTTFRRILEMSPKMIGLFRREIDV